MLPFIRTETKLNEKIRTIHSAKGTEFDSVMLVLDKNEFEKYIVKCKDEIENDNDESARIYYVALSRAKGYLFISIPSLDEHKMQFKNLKVVTLD